MHKYICRVYQYTEAEALTHLIVKIKVQLQLEGTNSKMSQGRTVR